MSPLKVPFLRLGLDSAEIKRLKKPLSRFLKRGQFILGPEVQKFEKIVASLCRQKYACGVGSGTDALYLALRSLGIGRGDEVITTSLSWVATANAIVMVGARPIFADVKEDLNLCPKSVESLITRKTKAILPVHFTGKMCDIRAIKEICTKHHLFLIEDCAQAIMAERDGFRAGQLSDCAAFSMNTMKVLAALGEAGCVCTSSAKLKKKLDTLRYNGCYDRVKAIDYSLNFRLDSIQAFVLNQKLKTLKHLIKKRQYNASIYENNLNKNKIILPDRARLKHVLYNFTVLVKNRNQVMKKLKKERIETKIQHGMPLFENPAFQQFKKAGYKKYKCKKLVKKLLCLPIHEKIRANEIKSVARALNMAVS